MIILSAHNLPGVIDSLTEEELAAKVEKLREATTITSEERRLLIEAGIAGAAVGPESKDLNQDAFERALLINVRTVQEKAYRPFVDSRSIGGKIPWRVRVQLDDQGNIVPTSRNGFSVEFVFHLRGGQVLAEIINYNMPASEAQSAMITAMEQRLTVFDNAIILASASAARHVQTTRIPFISVFRFFNVFNTERYILMRALESAGADFFEVADLVRKQISEVLSKQFNPFSDKKSDLRLPVWFITEYLKSFTESLRAEGYSPAEINGILLQAGFDISRCAECLAVLESQPSENQPTLPVLEKPAAEGSLSTSSRKELADAETTAIAEQTTDELFGEERSETDVFGDVLSSLDQNNQIIDKSPVLEEGISIADKSIDALRVSPEEKINFKNHARAIEKHGDDLSERSPADKSLQDLPQTFRQELGENIEKDMNNICKICPLTVTLVLGLIEDPLIKGKIGKSDKVKELHEKYVALISPLSSENQKYIHDLTKQDLFKIAARSALQEFSTRDSDIVNLLVALHAYAQSLPFEDRKVVERDILEVAGAVNFKGFLTKMFEVATDNTLTIDTLSAYQDLSFMIISMQEKSLINKHQADIDLIFEIFKTRSVSFGIYTPNDRQRSEYLKDLSDLAEKKFGTTNIITRTLRAREEEIKKIEQDTFISDILVKASLYLSINALPFQLPQITKMTRLTRDRLFDGKIKKFKDVQVGWQANTQNSKIVFYAQDYQRWYDVHGAQSTIALSRSATKFKNAGSVISRAVWMAGNLRNIRDGTKFSTEEMADDGKWYSLTWQFKKDPLSSTKLFLDLFHSDIVPIVAPSIHLLNCP